MANASTALSGKAFALAVGSFGRTNCTLPQLPDRHLLQDDGADDDGGDDDSGDEESSVDIDNSQSQDIGGYGAPGSFLPLYINLATTYPLL